MKKNVLKMEKFVGNQLSKNEKRNIMGCGRPNGPEFQDPKEIIIIVSNGNGGGDTDPSGYVYTDPRNIPILISVP